MAKVNFERDGNVAVITMSDPATLNAIDVEMSDELKAAFTRASDEARCVLLTGEGRAFSSGANLNAPRTNLDEQGRLDVGARLESHFNPLVTQLRDCPIPWISAVNGVAAGIGCSFALLGDLIVAGESAYFLQAFRRIGLVPDGSDLSLAAHDHARARDGDDAARRKTAGGESPGMGLDQSLRAGRRA